MKRALHSLCLLLVVGAIASTASAQSCPDCPSISCTIVRSDGTVDTIDGAICGATQASENGFASCRNVGSCRGCLGWACNLRGPVSAPPLKLVLRSTQITKDVAARQR